MECDKVKELLPFIDDGSVEKETEVSIKNHLRECFSCRTEYEKLSKIMRMVTGSIHEVKPDFPVDFLGDVRKKIEKKKRVRTFYFRAVTAAAVIVFTVSVLLFSFMNTNYRENVSEDYVNIEDLNGFDEFIASASLTGYDINELVEIDEEVDEEIVVTTLFINSYVNITTDDIIGLLDENELVSVFASLER